MENEALEYILKDIFGSYYEKATLKQLEEEKEKVLEVLSSYMDYQLLRTKEFSIDDMFDDLREK